MATMNDTQKTRAIQIMATASEIVDLAKNFIDGNIENRQMETEILSRANEILCYLSLTADEANKTTGTYFEPGEETNR